MMLHVKVEAENYRGEFIQKVYDFNLPNNFDHKKVAATVKRLTALDGLRLVQVVSVDESSDKNREEEILL